MTKNMSHCQLLTTRNGALELERSCLGCLKFKSDKLKSEKYLLDRDDRRHGIKGIN